tara:strand:+ start:152 stop:301 length:150 start_codon:yes stop_codon:yes gene_type:complete
MAAIVLNTSALPFPNARIVMPAISGDKFRWREMSERTGQKKSSEAIDKR